VNYYYIYPRSSGIKRHIKQIERNVIERRLKRLVDMQGSDAGFFTLAVHSFVESYLREFLDMESEQYHFPDLLDRFKEDLLEKNFDRYLDLSVLGDLNRKQRLANQIRHSFVEVDKEEARAATSRLVQFLRLSGYSDLRELEELKKSLRLWDERANRWEEMQELKRVSFQLLITARRNKDLSRKIEELERETVRREELSLKIDGIEKEIGEKTWKGKSYGEEIKRLENQRRELQVQLNRSSERIKELEEAQRYLENLNRMTSYTQTRRDYEKEIVRLTNEQKRVLDNISLGSDFLIKGGAGTGKTLVLLKALEKARVNQKQELKYVDLPKDLVLLTYTNTLVKYDRYIASIMSKDEQEALIQTADQVINKRFMEEGLGTVDYYLVKRLCNVFNTCDFFTNEELASEIEDFIFANNVTEEEYIEEVIPRYRRIERLNKRQREEVWWVVEKLIDEMHQKRRYSKNYARILLLKHLVSKEKRDLTRYEYVFVDEVQDLTSVDIAVLKAMASRALIMTGDSDQAIYRNVFPLKRSGVDVQGKSRILRTNFRNTIEIHRLAQCYRKANVKIGYDEGTEPEAFRVGPIPELFSADSESFLYELVVRRVRLFIKHLFYEPENIAVLVPDQNSIKRMREELSLNGIVAYDIRNNDFSFRERGIVRLSTLHSAKGLDFPVVMLFLPYLPYIGEGNDKLGNDQLYRNLIYVSITRAMDHINVFVMEGNNNPPVQDLVKCFGKMETSNAESQ